MSDAPAQAANPEAANQNEEAPAEEVKTTEANAAEVKPEETKKEEAPKAETAEAKVEAAKAAPATPAKPAAPAEPPFNTDLLQSSTARYTFKAWRLYHNHRNDVAFLREKPVRATIEARSIEGGEEIQKLLTEAGIRELSRVGNTVSFTATFEQIQTVIKHPQTQIFDAVAI